MTLSLTTVVLKPIAPSEVSRRRRLGAAGVVAEHAVIGVPVTVVVEQVASLAIRQTLTKQ